MMHTWLEVLRTTNAPDNDILRMFALEQHGGTWT